MLIMHHLRDANSTADSTAMPIRPFDRTEQHCPAIAMPLACLRMFLAVGQALSDQTLSKQQLDIVNIAFSYYSLALIPNRYPLRTQSKYRVDPYARS
jgi:hypothetical protein